MSYHLSIASEGANSFIPLTAEEERIGKIIVNCAFKLHSELGPGLLEKVYEVCFAHLLRKEGLFVQRQTYIQIVYDGLIFDGGLRLDMIVNDLVIVELKALENVNPVWEAQVLSHLRLTGRRLGYLINFNVPQMKQGIKRLIR